MPVPYDAAVRYDEPIAYDAGTLVNGGYRSMLGFWLGGVCAVSGTTTITGGHFLPHGGKHKRTLSNILTIYNEAKNLPRVETKELRDAIAEFVEAEVALRPYVPDIIKVDYEALSANDEAYEKFVQAITNIQKRIDKEMQRQAAEDDELLLMAVLACSIN